MKKVILLFLFVCSSVAYADEAVDSAKTLPATKLESFSAKTGIVIIRAFSNMGNIYGSGSGHVSVDAREFRDASNPKSREYGIAVEVKEAGRLERENTSYIDYDEIESLIRGIDYIAEIDKSVTSMDNFEAHYKTKGDFSIVTFSSQSGEIKVAVSSGRIGKTTAFLKLSDLSKLKDLVTQARSKIDSIRGSLNSSPEGVKKKNK